MNERMRVPTHPSQMNPQMMMMGGMKGNMMAAHMNAAGGNNAVSGGPATNGGAASWQAPMQQGSPGAAASAAMRQSPGMTESTMPGGMTGGSRMPNMATMQPNMPMEARRGSPGLSGQPG